jgi:hypothetical protein
MKTKLLIWIHFMLLKRYTLVQDVGQHSVRVFLKKKKKKKKKKRFYRKAHYKNRLNKTDENLWWEY